MAAPCLRNVDRPELCQVSLYDFQKFLLHDQKVGALRDTCGIPLSPNLRNSYGMPQPGSPGNSSHICTTGTLGQRRGRGAGLHVHLPQRGLQ